MRLRVNNISYSSLRKLLGIIIFTELFTFGSGQLIKVYGNVTLRIAAFFAMILIGITLIPIKKKMDKNVLFFLIYFSCLLILGTVLGLMHSSIDKVFIDVKYLSYFISIIFFYYYIKDLKDILLVVRVLTTSAFIVSLLYLIYLALYLLDVYDFESVYQVMSKHEDFRFRGTSGQLFYKGFINLPIALVFITIRKGMISFQSICILLAIYFTETRGLWLLAILAYIFSGLYILNKNGLKISIARSIILSILLLALILYISNNFTGLTGDRATGDIERIETIRQVIERVNISSLFIGHGFGVGVPIRQIHMEMSYLEIFHKLGLLGLTFYALLFLGSYKLFLQRNRATDLAAGFWFSICLVYIQSLINPYITNSIGMGFVVIAYISLYRLKHISSDSLKP